MIIVLVQATETKDHRLSGLKNRHLFLTVPEPGKHKVQMLGGSLSGENPLLGCRWLLSWILSPPDKKERKESGLSSSCKGTNPVKEAPPLGPFPKA